MNELRIWRVVLMPFLSHLSINLFPPPPQPKNINKTKGGGDDPSDPCNHEEFT